MVSSNNKKGISFVRNAVIINVFEMPPFMNILTLHDHSLSFEPGTKRKTHKLKDHLLSMNIHHPLFPTKPR